MAVKASTRRHHGASRNPTTATATAAAATAVHTHNSNGAGSDASPSEFMYVRATSATRTPTAALTGTHTSRQRRVRQPMPTIRTTMVTISSTVGNHPPNNEMPWPYLLKFGSGRLGIMTGAGGVGVVGPLSGGTGPV